MARYCSILLIAFALSAAMTSAAFAQQSIVFVDASSSNVAAPSASNTGSAWTGATTGAYKYLQNGLIRAGQLLGGQNPPAEVEIWVRGSSTGGGLSYRPDQGSGFTANDRTASFAMRPNVMVLGQFIGGTGANADTRDPAYLTILTGEIGADSGYVDNSYHVITANDSGMTEFNTLLDGFTITRGNGEEFGGGGLLIEDASPRIHDCIIADNRSGDVKTPQEIEDEQEDLIGGNSYGAGAQVNHSAVVFTLCTFLGNENNTGTVIGGGGVVVQNGPIGEEDPFSARLINCRFTDNQAGTGGGVMVRGSAFADITNSLFTLNQTVTGGGNLAPWGGGVAIAYAGAAADIVNCTFDDNSASKGGACAVYRTLAQSTIANSILWRNQAGQNGGDEIYIEGATSVVLTISDSNVRDKSAQGEGVVAPSGTIAFVGVQLGDNTTTDDPLYVGSGDHHLQCGSPSINIATSGADAAVPPDAFDLDNDENASEATPDLDIGARIVARVDMGCYETGQTGCLYDFNEDGTVGVVDLLTVITNWGACANPPPALCVGDTQGPCLNQGDGTVGVTDLLGVITAWGPSCGAIPVAMPQSVEDCMDYCSPLGIGSPEYADCVQKCTDAIDE